MIEELSLLLELVFHLEEIGEVGIGLDGHLDRERNLVVVENADLFLETITDRALSHHREVRVHVDGARGDRGKELDPKVVELVDGEHVGPISVHLKHELREKTGVVEEEALGVFGCCFDVASSIAHDEGVAIQNADRVLHDYTSGGVTNG